MRMRSRPGKATSRVSRAPSKALAVLVVTIGLCGCAPHAPREVGTTPSLTQEQQDAAAFEDLYRSYVALPLNEETEDDLREVLTGSALESDLENLRADRQSNRRTEGKDTFRGFLVTDQGNDPETGDYMVAQACLDVSGTRLLDAGGQDVTPLRDEAVSLQMKAVRTADSTWRISDFVRNDGVRACD
jgi:hypothetical protein